MKNLVAFPIENGNTGHYGNDQASYFIKLKTSFIDFEINKWAEFTLVKLPVASTFIRLKSTNGKSSTKVYRIIWV